ncbi:MAG: hypothetical protein U0269_05970 [Polyangiales bacterium]
MNSNVGRVFVLCSLAACSAGSTMDRDASTDASACSSLALGTSAPVRQADGGLPSPTGGAIAAGDYELREVLWAIPTAPRTMRGSMRVQGASIEMVLEEERSLFSASGTFVTFANNLEFSQRCPSPSMTGARGFTANSDRIDWYWSPNELHRWVRR